MDEDFETTTEMIREARENDAQASAASPTNVFASVDTSSTAPATSPSSTWNQAVFALAKNAEEKLETAKDVSNKVHETSQSALDNARDKAQDVVDKYSTQSSTSTSTSTSTSSKGVIEKAREAVQELLHPSTTPSTTSSTTSSTSPSILDKARDVMTHHDTTTTAPSKGVLDKVRDAAENLFGTHHSTSSSTTSDTSLSTSSPSVTGPVGDIQNVLDSHYPTDTTKGVAQQASKVNQGLMSSPWDEAVMRPHQGTLSVKNTPGTTTPYEFPTTSEPISASTTTSSSLSEDISSKAAKAAASTKDTMDKLKHEAEDIAHDVHLNSQMAGLAIKSKVEGAQHQMSHQMDNLKHSMKFNDKSHK